MRKYLFLGMGIFVLLGAFFMLRGNQERLVPISLNYQETSSSYKVEIADTSEKAALGLMYRKSMPQNHGMLFVFPYPKIVKMWMKNTYLPLDMIFFNAHNQVVCLHENARPLDESIISCPYPAQKVLELNAGEIRAKNIRLGTILNYPNSF